MSGIPKLAGGDAVASVQQNLRRGPYSKTATASGGISDLPMERWKEFGDVFTDSLWMLGDRDNSGAHNGAYKKQKLDFFVEFCTLIFRLVKLISNRGGTVHPQNLTETARGAFKALMIARAELAPNKMSIHRLPRWDERTRALIQNLFGAGELEKFERCLVESGKVAGFQAKLRERRIFVSVLSADARAHPDHYFLSPMALVGGAVAVPSTFSGRQFSPASDSRKVFIIHGHDETNVLRLKEFLREDLRLVPVVLGSKGGASATIIEKFEREAKDAFFAFAVFTPDDHVGMHSAIYAQPRPNAIFELGWFFRHLGRDGVCILLKHGTKMHSDLGGVHRIEFSNSISEKSGEIRREVESAQNKGAR